MKAQKRLEATNRWAQVAQGRCDEETLRWLASVARQLLETNAINDPSQRRDAIVRAVGMSGTLNPESIAIRALLDIPESAYPEQIAGSGPASRAARQRRLRTLVRLVCNLHDADDDAIDARIKRARKADK